jgi:hypothetical protein
VTEPGHSEVGAGDLQTLKSICRAKYWSGWGQRSRVGYLEKPFDLEPLIATIRRAVDPA